MRMTLVNQEGLSRLELEQAYEKTEMDLESNYYKHHINPLSNSIF